MSNNSGPPWLAPELSLSWLAVPVLKHHGGGLGNQLLWMIPAYLANILQWLVGFKSAITQILNFPFRWEPWVYLLWYWLLDVGTSVIFAGGDPRVSWSLRSHRLREHSRAWKFFIRLIEHIDPNHGEKIIAMPYGFGTSDNRKLGPNATIILIFLWMIGIGEVLYSISGPRLSPL